MTTVTTTDNARGLGAGADGRGDDGTDDGVAAARTGPPVFTYFWGGPVCNDCGEHDFGGAVGPAAIGPSQDSLGDKETERGGPGDAAAVGGVAAEGSGAVPCRWLQ